MPEEALNQITVQRWEWKTKFFWRSCVASTLVPSNFLCSDSNSSHTLGAKQATHTHNCHKITICLCNPNNTVGTEVLTSAPILVPGTLYNFSFIDSTMCYTLINWQLDSCDNGILHSGLPGFGLCHSSHIEKKNTFWGQDLFILEVWRHLLGWYWQVFSITGQYMSGEVFDSLYRYAHTIKGHWSKHSMECLQNNCITGKCNETVHMMVTSAAAIYAGLAF